MVTNAHSSTSSIGLWLDSKSCRERLIQPNSWFLLPSRMNSWLTMKCVIHSKFIRIFRLSSRLLTWTWKRSALNRWTPVIWKKKSLSLSKRRNSYSPRLTCSRQSPISKISKPCLKLPLSSEKSKSRMLSYLRRRENFLTWLNSTSLSFSL